MEATPIKPATLARLKKQPNSADLIPQYQQFLTKHLVPPL